MDVRVPSFARAARATMNDKLNHRILSPHRSVTSWMIERYLWRAIDKSALASADAFEARIEAMRIENATPFTLADVRKHISVPVKCDVIQRTTTYIWEYPASRAALPTLQPTIMFFHGGGYIDKPLHWHFRALEVIGRTTGARIIMPAYPLIPATAREAYDALLPWYAEVILRGLVDTPIDGTVPHLTFLGDSAGGGMVFGLTHTILVARGAARDAAESSAHVPGTPGASTTAPVSNTTAEFAASTTAPGEAARGESPMKTGPNVADLPLPAQLIGWSPWVDVTSSVPGMEAIEPHDPMLDTMALRRCGKAWAGEEDIRAGHISPLFSEFHAAFPTTRLFVGTREVFLPEVEAMYRALRASGAEVTLHIYPGQNHDFQMFPCREGSAARTLTGEFIAAA